MQVYKNIYFKDKTDGKSSVTIAFGPHDNDLYEHVKPLSSEAIRQLLGYQFYKDLAQAAHCKNESINAHCLESLRQRHAAHDNGQAPLPGLQGTQPFHIDPIQATFRGGGNEPLHSWYPYLEGYSPDFVHAVYSEFCSDATSVFDPFSGGGTTPLTIAQHGVASAYCEVNPLLQYLTESKIQARTLEAPARKALCEALHDLAETLDDRMARCHPDQALAHAYESAFGDSAFFDPKVFKTVLKLRRLIDEVSCTAPLAARYLTIAVLSALIPASRLVRRGDLRFKNDKEAAKGPEPLLPLVRRQLGVISTDIEGLSQVPARPTLLLENAKNLGRLPNQNFDAVITSPPYLNGTNYFRNTKVELWFLRCLNKKSDLAAFRYNAMTVGINDVTVKKQFGDLPESAQHAVSSLQESAYDPRIPRMVGSYAGEMATLLGSLNRHMTERGKIAIDIGDSAYAGVHVPTDRFITETMSQLGWDLACQTILRQRLSRSQFPLHQTLLVFEQKTRRNGQAYKPISAPHWQDAWRDFKHTLPHQNGTYAKRNWGHPLHSLCSYQGKMKPSLAAHLVKTFAQPGDRLLDPFSGVGTIPFEAAIHGVEPWAFDISPPAVHISAAKIGQCDRETCLGLIDVLENKLQTRKARKADIEDASHIHFNGALPDYFSEKTFREVLIARRYFIENPPRNSSESLVYACLLHILHGNRPYALSRRSHPITPFAPTGPAEYRPLIPRLREKVERSLRMPIPDNFVHGQSLFHDATAWWPHEARDFDVILTSPPFYDSTRFSMGNWMRLWFTGWDKTDFSEKPQAFIDQRQKTTFQVYEPVLRQCRERLKPGGVVVFHLGASKKCDMAAELAEVARTWFNVVDIFRENVSHCESHGIRDKGAVGHHQYLILR